MMSLRFLATISLISCAFFQQSAAAESTVCENQNLNYLYWVQKYFDLADVVFLGKVVSEESPDPPARFASGPANASSMAELIEMIEAGQSQGPQPDRLQTATFEIHKSWKGPAGPMINVKWKLQSDDTGMFVALGMWESYLIFGFKSDDDDAFRIPKGCVFHPLAKDTSAKIRVLDALTK